LTDPVPRRQARERALELLYEADVKGVKVTSVVAALPLPPDRYTVAVVSGVEEHQDELDRAFGRHARAWTVDRMPMVDRNVLRLATFELAHRPDVPVAVVIDEAVELAKRFSTDDSGRFVNGVLRRVAEDVRASHAAAGDVEVVLVDVDGVIRHWDEDELRAAEVALGLPSGALVEVAFEAALMNQALTGAITDEQWRAEIGTRTAARFGVDAAKVSALWQGVGWRVDEDVLDVLDRVQATVALFSNATTRLEDDLRACGVYDRVDRVLNSARLGLAKPEPEAFAAAAEALGVEPGRCLFVDDRPANVDGARAAGMRAELFTGAEALAELLAEGGLLPAS
jgi:putative hydrolase of the HAD superfamily